MKINIVKLLALASRIVVAAPAIVAAVKPILHPRAPSGGTNIATGRAPGADEGGNVVGGP